MQENLVRFLLCCNDYSVLDLGPECSSTLTSVAEGPGCISWAMHHVKKALTGAFQFAFVRLSGLLHCPRWRRMEECITQCEWVNGGEGGECVCARGTQKSIRVSDELHKHFLPAFKPSQKSLLCNPLSSMSSFLKRNPEIPCKNPVM